MKKNKLILSLFATLLIVSCNEQAQHSILVNKIVNDEPQYMIIPNEPSVRGLDVYDSNIAWISGSKGMFARTIDGGKNWESGTIKNDTLLDFRDIQAFGSETALALSAGLPARIYKTNDGGKTWSLTYENTDEGIFFDSFEFWNESKGVACSDPVNGEFVIITTDDGGESWQQVSGENLPDPLKNEAGFAASGTSVAISADGTAMFGTGGEKARIILSKDFGKTWQAIVTPINVEEEASGIYSIASLDNNVFALTGGSYLKEDIAYQNFAISVDGGLSWGLSASMPSGFRSCVRFFPKTKKSIITCGRNGVDISFDLGENWMKTQIPGFYTMDISPNEDFIIFAGAKGKIAYFHANK